MEEGNKRNEVRKYYTISRGVMADFQARKSVEKARTIILIVND